MKNEFKKYFMVIAKCGHVGRKNYIPIKFAVVAESGKDAAKKVRQFPRVKHNHKDAILDVRCITLEEFLEIKEINDKDPYLKCHSKQEQNLITIVSETNDTLYLNYPCYTQSNTQIETNYWTSSYDFGTKNAEDDVVCRVPNWTNFAIGTYSSIKISPYNACLIRPVKDRE